MQNYSEPLQNAELEVKERIAKLFLSKNIDNLDDFCRELYLGNFTQVELVTFCQNSIFKSSLPYLKAILRIVDELEVKLEAYLAIHSIQVKPCIDHDSLKIIVNKIVQ